MIDHTEKPENLQQFLLNTENQWRLVENKKIREYSYFHTSGSFYEWNTCLTHSKKDPEQDNSQKGIEQHFGFSVSYSDTKKYLETVANDYILPFIMRAHQHLYLLAPFETENNYNYYFDTNLMPIFFTNYYISFLWNRQNPLVFTLCFNPFSGAGMPTENFPGIMNSTVCEISDSGNRVTAWRLPNNFISDETRQKHSISLATFLEPILFPKKTSPTEVEEDNQEFFTTIKEHFSFYKIHSKELFRNNFDQIKSFCHTISNTDEPERVATWNYNTEHNEMNLEQFFMPQSLLELQKK